VSVRLIAASTPILGGVALAILKRNQRVGFGPRWEK